MKIDNLFKMNDWNIKKFLKLILVIQLALWGLIGLDAAGLQSPILRPIVGFFYITFIPGLLILRILRLHKLSNIETLLYTVGLSLTTLMFTSLLMNIFYPKLGISGPISTTPLIITISAMVLILCILCYFRDKDFSDSSFLDIKNILSPPALFLFLIPFFSIFGAYFVNTYQNNILLLILLIIISSVPVLIIFKKIPERLYSLAVFVVSISLLYHFSLISNFLIGTDVLTEFFYTKLTLIESQWDPSSRSVISTTLLPVIFSKFCDISITWVYKIIFPFFFSLVPIGAYYIYNKVPSLKLDKCKSFLAIFFVMSILTFYHVMPGLAKQSLAALFYILIMMIAFVGEKKSFGFKILLLSFSVCLIFSHYGMSYLFLILLTTILFWSLFFRGQKLLNINWIFLCFFFLSCITWYAYTEGASNLNSVIYLGRHLVSNLKLLGSPSAAASTRILYGESPNLLHIFYRYISYVSVFLIFVGGFSLFFNMLKTYISKKREKNLEFKLLVLANFVLLGITILPIRSLGFGFSRIFHITSLVLAPCIVIGARTLYNTFTAITTKSLNNLRKCSKNNFSRRKYEVLKSDHSKRILAIFLTFFLLFNSGFVFEVTKDPYPSSIPLSLNSSEKNVPKENLLDLRAFVQTEGDISGAVWLKENKECNYTIYATYYDIRVHSLESYALLMGKYKPITPSTQNESGYIYLWYINTQLGLGSTSPTFQERFTKIKLNRTWPIKLLSPNIYMSNKIYSNNISQIYLKYR